MAAGVNDRSGAKGAALLRLLAEDQDDLAVLAACLQDAVAVKSDMIFQPRQRRFAMVVNRYRWEQRQDGRRAGRRGQRIRCGVHFDDVTAVEVHGIDQQDPAQVLELLTIAAEPNPEGGATIGLLFAGGPMIRLQVGGIACQLADMGAPWDTPLKPRHGVAPAPTTERGRKS